MDAGGSCHSCNYRLQNRTEKRNKRKRGLDNEQRYFYGTDGKREYKAVRSILDVMNTVDIASLLEELDDRGDGDGFPPDSQRESGGCVFKYE